MATLLIVGSAVAGAAILLGRKGGGRSRRASSIQRVGPNANLLNPAAALQAIKIAPNDFPEKKFDIPFAAGDPRPVWPIVTKNPKKFMVSYRTVSGSIVGNGARRFMVNRDGGDRYHVGIDLYGNPDDPVLAMEDGVIVNHYGFYHGTDAVIFQCKSGLVINYGEVKSGSWKEFGFGKGSAVKKGQALARVGLMTGGSHMCHFETYMPGTTRNIRYFGGNTEEILNPTYYLLLALSRATKGRSFSMVNCEAMRSLNQPIPRSLIPIAIEDERVGDGGGDSVLPELLTSDMWRSVPDRADGP